MDKSFMGLPLPPDWTVTSDAFGSHGLIAGGALQTHMSSLEIYHRIARYWNMKPEERNEQHRKPDQAPRNTTPAQPPAGNAGRASQGSLTAAPAPRTLTAADYARQALIPGGIMPLPSNTAERRAMIEAYQRIAMLQALTPARFLGADFADPPPKPAALPRIAPMVGELIGHRAWKVEGGNLLRSYSAGSAWFPGLAMQDKIGKGQEIDDHNTAGIWAFKDPYELAHEFYDEIRSGGVFGTVWLWGTVIEHECGYRAQYASIRSLDRAGKGTDLEVLRAAYLPKKTNADK